MYEITNRTDAPYRSIAYVVSTWATGAPTRATGTVVGVNDVLTALHAVYNLDRGGWATSVKVTPAADTLPFEAPYGSFTASRLDGRTANWDTNGDQLLSYAEVQYDLAVIGLDQRVGDVTGWLPTLALASGFDGIMAGYPARGTGLMAEAVHADVPDGYGMYVVGSVLGGGASGGPLLNTLNGQTYVVGALSGGTSFSAVYAGLQASGNWAWLNAALASNDDLIAGKVQVVFMGMAGNDQLLGNALANTLQGDAGNDVIDGGDGVDTAVFKGLRSSYALTLSQGTARVVDLVEGRDGTDVLAGVERLRFADKSLALDIAGPAGSVALMLGAVFGPDAVANRDYVATGLRLLDAGMALTELAQFALDTRLGTGASAEAVVADLYTHVVGVAPGAFELAWYTGLLQYTPASLVLMAMHAPENGVNIDLTGLASSGLEYTTAI